MKNWVSLVALIALAAPAFTEEDAGLRPWSENPFYWQYQGKPTLLLGASDDDNLFQWPSPKLEEQLDALAEVGGNFIRNTMSDRHDMGWELYPFKQLEDGRYDLSQWNGAYWQRFEHMLDETSKRGIVVQIEVWDRFDYTDNKDADRWQNHPYNPKNNVNYSYKESGFAERYPDHPGANKQPFFFTTPKQRNNTIVLPFQVAFVDKMLSYSLDYGNVLYCMDNETRAEEAWARFWAEHIKQRAAEAGKTVCVTEMWDDWNLRDDTHKRTFDHPERYDFVDVSQNNQMKGQEHWDNFLWVRAYLAAQPRPMNTTKTYGADGGKYGDTNEALDRFWRHVLAGVAAARFHRPDSGLGLSAPALATIKSVRLLESVSPLWELHAANELLGERNENEAYLAANPGKVYALYFRDGGAVTLDLSAIEGSSEIRWIDIAQGTWAKRKTVKSGAAVPVKAPAAGHWLAVVTPARG